MEVKKRMENKFGPELKKAWLQYQDMYDRYFALLRLLVLEDDIDKIRGRYGSHIEYAMKEWNSPRERFETGDFGDLDLGL